MICGYNFESYPEKPQIIISTENHYFIAYLVKLPSSSKQ